MVNNVNISDKLRQTINRELYPGENIEYIEQPVPPKMLTVGSIFSLIIQVAFSLPFIGGGLACLLPFLLSFFSDSTTNSSSNILGSLFASILFTSFFLVFFSAGMSMLISALTNPQKIRKIYRNTIYLITDKRIITINGGQQRIIKSIFPQQIQHVYRTELSDSLGDVVMTIRGSNDTADSAVDTIRFNRVREPQNLERMLSQLS